MARDLKARGHRVIAFDVSPTLVRLAAEADPEMDVRVADAAYLPLEDGAADLAVAFMSLHDMNDMPAAVRETARVLATGGHLCLAILHPINSAGRFLEDRADSPFVIESSYLHRHRYVDAMERDGLRMTFHSDHRPLQDYFTALEDAGFLMEALREPTIGAADAQGEPRRERWLRVPLFVNARAVKR